MNSRTNIELEIDFTGAVLVRWTGRANERRPSASLEPVFERLLGMGRYLRFDFTEVEHMSSSTLVVLLKFFKQLNAMGVGFDYRYDRSVSWQRMTFAQLDKVMAPQPSLIAA
ncbi:MAG: anti-sigma factor antagonist [Myxococcales bacterium]|nr:anti-sigma factor antagonist [Myxococcales bacterium]MCA9696968.1 anti-sigma factor antagonist [Myxococcales bacterium]